MVAEPDNGPQGSSWKRRDVADEVENLLALLAADRFFGIEITLR